MKAPTASDACTALRMRANVSRDTGPEVALRRQLWAIGARGYRVHRGDLPGNPDIVFGKAKVAVFIHGCFWHRCLRCNKSLPKRNKEYWEAKFRRNVLRDQHNSEALTLMGWQVVTSWECGIRADVAAEAERISQLTATTGNKGLSSS